MLFVNIDPNAGSFEYPNTFPEAGRRLVWFPSPGQTERHPVLRRMLGLQPLPKPGDGFGSGPSSSQVTSLDGDSNKHRMYADSGV